MVLIRRTMVAMLSNGFLTTWTNFTLAPALFSKSCTASTPFVFFIANAVYPPDLSPMICQYRIKGKSEATFPIVTKKFSKNNRKISVPVYSDHKTDISSANSNELRKSHVSNLVGNDESWGRKLKQVSVWSKLPKAINQQVTNDKRGKIYRNAFLLLTGHTFLGSVTFCRFTWGLPVYLNNYYISIC